MMKKMESRKQEKNIAESGYHSHEEACGCSHSCHGGVCSHHQEKDYHEAHQENDFHEAHEGKDCLEQDHREHKYHKHQQHEHGHGEACSCGHEHHHSHGEVCDCGHRQEDTSCTESHTMPAGVMQKTYILENLGCANCAAKMERKINNLPEVEAAVITFATKKLVVASWHQENLLPVLQKICASVESEVVVVSQEEKKISGKEKISFFMANRKDILTIGAGAVLFAAGIVLENISGGAEISLIAETAVFIAAYLILGLEIVWKAVKNLLNGHIFDENFLMSAATIAAFAIGDFAEAVGVMLFYRVGEFFENAAVERSRSQIMEAVDMRPEVVNVIRGGEPEEIPAEEAVPGDIILIRPGDRIPLDGRVLEGESRIDTSPVTGEPVPVRVSPGEEVVSGCVNEQGVLKVEVWKALNESMVTRILDSVEHAAASKPKIDKFITRFARIYTPIVVGAAVLTAVLPSLVTGNWNHWIYTAITFLVISCPCALVLSVPLAFFSGIGAGSRKGILFKGGIAIEALKGIKAVVMDKTGTITKGNFAVHKVVAAGSLTKKQILTIAADCELDSTHPIGCSIVQEARAQELELVRAQETEEISGKGIRAVFPEGTVLCGNCALMEMYHVDMSRYKRADYGTEVLIAVDGMLEGYLNIADILKEDAKSSVAQMKQQGLVTAMLTGDAKDSAAAVAEETGIDEVYAQLLPQEKLEHLQKIRQKRGAVMFVGDGINDAPVLAGADVGAAMGSGADAAIEAADVVFMTSALQAIPDSVNIARMTGRIAVQNVVFALIIKLLVMVLGFAGYANMWLAVFADTGVAMLCVLNSIRILWKK